MRPRPTNAQDEVDLQVAVMVGNLQDVQTYIKHGGDLEVKDDDRATVVFHAACWNHVEIMKTLISGGANLYAQRNDGFTALHVAAKNNQPKIVEVLVEAMDDLGIQEEFGDTALHCAYRSKATECIETLLAAGANSETRNHMGKTPRECEGTGVDRQDYDEGSYFDDDDNPHSTAASEAPSNDASTVVGGAKDDGSSSAKSPSRPTDGRSTGASSSPRTNRNRSGAHNGDRGGGHGITESNVGKAHFRIAHPPTTRGGGPWQPMTAYLFEPFAHRAVRHAHEDLLSGDQHHAFVPSDATNSVEDYGKTIPLGTQVVIRPRFPRGFGVSPVNATVEWTKEAHAFPFELRPPASISSGTVSGCVDFYVGPVLIGQAYVEMAVGKPNDRSNAADKPSVLGPVTKVFDSVYMCFAAADEPLLLPSLERFKRLGIVDIAWRPERESDERESKRLIRESSVFQICWSISAKESNRVRDEVKYASSLAKAGSVAVRGIYWNPSMDATSIQTAQGLVFPVRLHNSFLLEDPRILLADVISSESHDGAIQGTNAVPEAEKLCTAAVEHTRGHISRLRGMVDGAEVLDVPRIVWIHPDDDSGKPGSVDITTDDWLKKPIRVNFMCPISMKPGRCGEDGKGYKMSFPRGWNGKIGVSLKIGVVVVAAASDAGEIADLPAPCAAAVAAWGGENAGARSSAEKQGDLVNAAFDGLAGAVPDKWNDLVDSAFMDAESEEGHSPPVSAQMRKEAKQSYANLRSLLQKYDKGLKMTGLVKVTHEGASGRSSTTEWVHPSVAELFRRKGPAIFDRGALAAADAEAALEAAVRHKAAAMKQKKEVPGAASTAPCGTGKGERGTKGQQEQALDVMSTIRVLENQVLALVEGTGGVSGSGA
eukprot:g14083.t1